MDEHLDAEFTLRNIPCPSKEQCEAVGQVLVSEVMSKALTLDEMKKRRALVLYINESLRMNNTGYLITLFGPSLDSIGFMHSEIHGSVLNCPDVTGNKTMGQAFPELLNFFKTHDNFEVLSSFGSEICIRSKWSKGSQAKMIVRWGMTDDVSLTQLYCAYASLSPLVQSLVLVFGKWASLHGLNTDTTGLRSDVFVVMVIFYLQKIGELSLTDFHSHFDTTNPSFLFAKGNVTAKSLGLHWIQFLKFYSVDFDPRKEDIYIGPTCNLPPAPLFQKLFIRDPGKPENSLISEADIIPFGKLLGCLREGYLYFGIPRSVPGPLYHRILPQEKASLCRSTVFQKFVPSSTEAAWKPLEDITYPEWDPIVIAEEVKGRDWRKYDNFAVLELESVRVEVYERRIRMDNHLVGVGNVRCVLLNSVSQLSDLLHRWFYRYELTFKPDLLLLHGVAIPVLNPVVAPLPALHAVPQIFSPSVMPLPVVCPTVIRTALDQALHMNFDVDGMKEDDYMLRVGILGDLHKALFPLRVRFQIFGSCANGFGRKFSDLDVFAVTQDHIQAPKVLDGIQKLLKKSPVFTNVRYIRFAEVPLVKFCHLSSGIDGDISCNNEIALRNTRLLRTYAEIDPRVKILGIFLKTVADICQISETRRGDLSPYAYLIMLIHYLQRTQPPVLPFLQELSHGFMKRISMRGYDVTFFTDLRNLPSAWCCRSVNTKSVGELWLEFLHYYLNIFNGREQVVTIRQSLPLTRKEKNWLSNKDVLLTIEDPFITDKNLAKRLTTEKSLYIFEVFAQLRDLCFKDCYRSLLCQKDFDPHAGRQAAISPCQARHFCLQFSGHPIHGKKVKSKKKLKAEETVATVVFPPKGTKSSVIAVTADKSLSVEIVVESKLSSLKI